MSVKESLEEYKLLVGLILLIVGATVGNIAWTQSTVEKQVQMSEAKAALAHDFYFQQSRINIKRIQIEEAQRELKRLLEYIGDDPPTARQEREISLLDARIVELKRDIEEIEAELAK